jgi:hypothetical protein
MASTSQFPVANTSEKLTADEAAGAAIERLTVVLAADGWYHLAESRADGADGISEFFMVKQADGFYHLNDASAGARRISYFPAIAIAVL